MSAILSAVTLAALPAESIVILSAGEDAGTAWVHRLDGRWSSVRVTALCVGPGIGESGNTLANWAPVLLHTPGDGPPLAPEVRALYAERWPASPATTTTTEGNR